MKGFLELLQRRIWLGPLIALIVGLGLGLLFAWVIWPVSWAPGTGDVNAMATWYATDPEAALNYTRQILAGASKDEQSALFTRAVQQSTARNQSIQAQRITALGQALGVKVGTSTPPAPTGGATTPPAAAGTPIAFLQQFGPILLLLLVMFAIVAAAAWVLIAKVVPQVRAGQAPRSAAAQGAAPPPPAPSARPVETPAATTSAGLGSFKAEYALGNDNYDTSFSLETPRQEFLGECGVGISETIGEGKPDKVTAFDLWLFDKADVRTVTQILMSEYAYNDQQLRGKLAAKGEAVLAEKGKIITLETQSLRLAATVTDLAYANSPGTPPNSYFQKLVVEIVPTLKELVAA